MTKYLNFLCCLPFIAIFASSCGPSTPITGKTGTSSGYTAFDAWRTSNRITPHAASGSARALHDLFIATYTRASDPYQGGEDLEQMCSNLGEVAAAIGDSSFADGLKRERPEVVNAVRVIGAGCLKSYPQTNAAIRSVPVMTLPLEYSTKDVRTPLMNALIKEEG
jgi:hypothetical protein